MSRCGRVAFAPVYSSRAPARLAVALAVVLGTSLASPRAQAATWTHESDRVIAAARQHLGQYPYGFADGGSRSGYLPQLMFAGPPYVSSSIDGMDCVGFVYVVYSETGHGASAAIRNRIVDHRRDVGSMYSLYEPTGYGRASFDGALVNQATTRVDDGTAQPGDLLIFKANDGSAPTSGNLKHVGIYTGSGRMINMTSRAVLEIPVSSILGTDGKAYVMAAVVHTHLYVDADGSAVPALSDSLPAAPIAETQAIFDVTGYFTSDSSGTTYHPAAAANGRLLDSRYFIGVSGHFQAWQPQTFRVAGYGNVPSYAVAVTGNVTVTNQAEAGWVAIAPGGTLQADVQPETSTINFPKGDNRANAVSVALSSDGRLDAVYIAPKGKTTDIIFDVTGYYTDDATGATYHPLGSTSGNRVLDSRSNVGVDGPFIARQPQTFRVAMYPGSPYGPSDVPADAVAVTGNVTIANQKVVGYVTIAPGGTLTSSAPPQTSTLNFPAGDYRANGVTVGLGNGSLDAVFWATSGATAHIIFDVTGYYTNDASGATYHPRTSIAHARVLDSRSAIGVSTPFHAREPLSFQVTQVPGDPYSVGDVPPGAVAVTGNLTLVNQACKGWATIAPGDTLEAEVAPDTSTINFPAGDTRANGVTVGLSSTGRLDLVYWWKPPENPKIGTDPCR